MNQTLKLLVHHSFAVCCAFLFASHSSLSAATFKVGSSAGTANTACQYLSPQAAIDHLPIDQEMHFIEMEQGQYFDHNASIKVDGRSVTVVTAYKNGSKCRQASTSSDDVTVLSASSTAIDEGRTVVVKNGGSLVLDRIAVVSNMSGGILVRDGALVLESSLVHDNSTQPGVSGAGIFVDGGILELRGSSLRNNVASGDGGAIFCAGSDKGGRAFVKTSVSRGQGTEFRANAARNGGAIYLLSDCRVSLQGAFLSGNSSIQKGGAIASSPTISGVVNVLEFDDLIEDDRPYTGVFIGNSAGKDGGAISLAGSVRMIGADGGRLIFGSNAAGLFGGAIDVAGTDALATVNNAEFLANSAGLRGGAVSVSGGGAALLRASCGGSGLISEDYCAVFDGNEVPSVDGRRGGALSLGDGDLSVDSYAFRDSRGPSSGAITGGLIAWIDAGFMKVSNSLVYDNTEGLDSGSVLFMLNGGLSQFSFNTMVGTTDGAVISARTNASAELVGNIIAENRSGVVADGGSIRGTCNNAQTGTSPAPLDPKFETTPAGRFRLAPDSPMRDGALGCESSQLPVGYAFPVRDLDGFLRRETGEAEQELDLGAFEFIVEEPSIFRSGFDPAFL